MDHTISAALDAGVSGYILKDDLPTHMAEAIREMAPAARIFPR